MLHLAKKGYQARHVLRYTLAARPRRSRQSTKSEAALVSQVRNKNAFEILKLPGHVQGNRWEH
jgi:hypothetical protein